MLQDLEKLIQNLKSFSFAEEERKILYIEEDDILNYVRGQMSLGKTGNGDEITLDGKPFYAQYTIEVKKEFGVGLGRVTDWITLFMTGEFYASLFVNFVESGDFQILSKDPKYPKIALRSGTNILELNEVNLETIQKSANIFLQESYYKLFES